MTLNFDALCKKLKTEYDATILEKYPPFLKKLFIDTIKEHTTIKERNPLSQLILNLDKNPPEVDYLTGPAYIQKFENKTSGKTIYLFGEIHPDVPGCEEQLGDLSGIKHMHVIDYFKELIETTPKFIDLFIELGSSSIKDIPSLTFTEGQNLVTMKTEL